MFLPPLIFAMLAPSANNLAKHEMDIYISGTAVKVNEFQVGYAIINIDVLTFLMQAQKDDHVH